MSSTGTDKTDVTSNDLAQMVDAERCPSFSFLGTAHGKCRRNTISTAIRHAAKNTQAMRPAGRLRVDMNMFSKLFEGVPVLFESSLAPDVALERVGRLIRWNRASPYPLARLLATGYFCGSW